MDILNFFQLINDNPVCYFVTGVVLGYFLRSIVSVFRGNKKPGRYQTRMANSSINRPSIAAEPDEPSFDWSDAVVKTVTSSRLTKVSLDQHGNEFP